MKNNKETALRQVGGNLRPKLKIILHRKNVAQRSIKRFLATVLSLIVIMCVFSFVSFAASAGKVKTLKVSSYTDNSITLSWSKVSSASGYRLYSYDAAKKEWKTKKTTASLSFTDKSLACGKQYKYRIRAYRIINGKKVWGEYSNTLTAQTRPQAVSCVTVSSESTTSLRLSWKKSSAATGYRVYIYDPSAEKWVTEKTTASLSYTDSSLKSATKYVYKIKAYTKIGEKVTWSTASEKITAITKPAASSFIKTGSISSSQLTVTWAAVKGASGYEISHYDAAKKAWATDKKTTALSYTAKSLLPATQYKYRVRAYTQNAGKIIYGAYTSSLSVLTPPETVKDLKASCVTDSQLQLTWSKAKGAAGYKVYKLNEKTGTYELYKATDDSQVIISSLSPYTDYSFKVRAYAKQDTTCYGAYSQVLCVKTTLCVTKNLAAYSSTEYSVKIAWNKTENANGYELYEYDDVKKAWSLSKTLSENEYTLSFSEPGSCGKYKVRAFAKSGNKTDYGGYSNVLCVCSLPEKPSGLETATGSDNSVVLRWEKVGKAAGYEVFRYNALNGSWDSIGECEKCEYIDKNLTATSEYSYRVRAYIDFEGERFYSDCSKSAVHLYKAEKEPENPYVDLGSVASTGIIGYLYDQQGEFFYTAGDPWQRNFGFNALYDVAAPITLINYDTVRFKFEYDNRDWMIQLWKGQYGMVFYGGEVGVYTKPKDRKQEHYDCADDEDMLKMSMVCYEREWSGFKRVWNKKFERQYGSYWWCTGFVPGYTGLDFSDLMLDIRITMKSFDMLSGFTKSLDKHAFEYEVNGLDVYFKYR